MLFSALQGLFRPTLTPLGPCAPALPDAGPQAVAPLTDVATGQHCQVMTVTAPTDAPDWARWLAEIGFVAGEPAVVTARSPWGDGALVVRIGTSNFALRREEASCVSVRIL